MLDPIPTKRFKDNPPLINPSLHDQINISLSTCYVQCLSELLWKLLWTPQKVWSWSRGFSHFYFYVQNHLRSPKTTTVIGYMQSNSLHDEFQTRFTIHIALKLLCESLPIVMVWVSHGRTYQFSSVFSGLVSPVWCQTCFLFYFGSVSCPCLV